MNKSMQSTCDEKERKKVSLSCLDKTRALSTSIGRAGPNATLRTSQGPNKLNEKCIKF